METAKLKKFAQFARRSLMEQVSAKLKLVFADDSAARRESAKAVKELDEAIQKIGKEQVIERVAYIWFNRFCALRFMDVNRYTRIGVVSPAEGQSQPEILAEAKMGHIDEEMVPEKVRQQIFALLDGKAPSRDPQGEAYRLLVVAACNFFHRAMPFLFQRIDDYTELLMPDDLLSGNSILAYTREAMTPDACEDVEVIGWLYQFYISEKKDEVFAGLKKGKKIGPENIPAATQLFTPHWIVRYLVENSLGRLWMLNRPNSRLKERMDYYIEPDEKITAKNTQDINHEKHEPHENKNQEDFRDVSAFRGSKAFLAVNSLGEDLTTKNTKGTKEKNKENNELAGNAENKTFRDFRAFRGSEKDFLVVNSPEEIKICDPACGSGHMLTYAFDLLYAIYEEEGYEPAEIPEKILTNNLYGIEIDERAGELAAFALTMKARAKQRRFFNKGVKPNICVLENVRFDEGELKNYMDFVGRDLFTAPLQTTLRQFEETDNFGSLIRPDVTDVDGMRRILESKNVSGQLFLSHTHQKVLQALRQADYLNPKYHVVIANPPYMGGSGMNGRLGAWAKDNFPNTKSDLFAMFIERNLYLAQKHGAVAMITMQSWMFLSSFEALRARVLGQNTLLTMAHLGARAFDSIGGEVVSTTAFVLENANRLDYKGSYLRLVDGNSEAEKNDAIREAVKNPDCGWFYHASAVDFRKIPGCPVAYWVSDAVRSLFDHPKLGELSDTRLGMATANNDLFMRQWTEVSFSRSMLNASSRNEAESSGQKWFPYQKGGEFRKWFGNLDYLVNWQNDGEAIRNFVNLETGKVRSHNYNLEYIFREGVTWNALTSYKTSARISRNSLFDNAGSSLFAKDTKLHNLMLAYLNSNLIVELISLISPTLNYQPGDIGKLPAVLDIDGKGDITKNAKSLIKLSSDDWDSFETSWDFTSLPLLSPDYRQPTLNATYQKLRAHWQEITLEVQRLEEENNRIFIKAYGLQDELTPEVPLNEITLTCNPYYRYGKEANHETHETHEKEKKQHSGEAEKEIVRDFRVFRGSNGFPIDEELEARLLADTMRELVSYAVGCMFGRYALDKPGLILANQGETIEDYYEKLFNHEKHELHEKENKESFRDFRAVRGSCLFPADEDNVIPMLDGDWFADDIAERFRKFLRVAFGEEHYEENLRFVEQALNIKGKRNYSIRDYFLGEFYADHVRRYKKRPIYWLFSSPKGSFNALIYMHRYRPDTVSMVLNEYLREFKIKLTAHKNHLEAVSISASARPAEKTAAIKEIEKLNKTLAELDEWEREVLYPLAARRIEIDLDDGVKVNYNKFGAALKKVPGLSE